MKKSALTEEVELEEKREEIEEEKIPEIEISQTSGNWESQFLWGIIKWLLILGLVVGVGGHWLEGWSWFEAMIPTVMAVFGIVYFIISKTPNKRALLVGFGLVLFLIYPAFILDQVAELLTSIQTTIATLKPNIIFVQNSGQYNPIKYGVTEFFQSIPFQLIIAMAITAMSYVSISFGKKKVHVPFHIGLLLVELLIMQGFFWSSGRIDPATSLATNTIFFMGIIMSAYWGSIIDHFIIPQLSRMFASESQIMRFIGDELAAPIIMFGMGIVTPIMFGVMTWFVSETALTLSMSFKVITLGYIVGILISGVIREISVITYSPKRQFRELDEVLE